MADIHEASEQFLSEIRLLQSSERIRAFEKYAKQLKRIEFTFPEGLKWINTQYPLDPGGKVTLLDFWTYCCINCIHILPHIKALEEKYTVSDGLLVIGIHSPKFDNEKCFENLKSAVQRLDITHPVVNDPESVLWCQYGISCWPTRIVLDPEGYMILNIAGEGHEKEIDTFISAALLYYEGQIDCNPIHIGPQYEAITDSLLKFPSKLAIWERLLAVSDSGHHRVLIINLNDQLEEVVGGPVHGFQDGTFKSALFFNPQGLVFKSENQLLVADTDNHAIRLIDLSQKIVSTLVGTGNQGFDHIGGLLGVNQCLSSPSDLIIVPSSLSENTRPPEIPKAVFSQNVPPPLPPLPPLLPLSNSAQKNVGAKTKSELVLLIAMSGLHQIWAYFFENTVWWNKEYKKGTCVAVAGSGCEENKNNSYPMRAGFAQPSGLAFSQEKGLVFIADSESSSIRQLDLRNGSVSCVVGGNMRPDDLFAFGDVDGQGKEVRLQHPLDVCWSDDRNCLYICDSYNNKIKQIDPIQKSCSTVDLKYYKLNEPSGLSVSGTNLYIVDTNNHTICLLDLNSLKLKPLEISVQLQQRTLLTREVKKFELSVIFYNGNFTIVIEFPSKELTGQFKLKQCPSNIMLLTDRCPLQDNKLELLFEFIQNSKTATIQGDLDLGTCDEGVCKVHRFSLVFHLRFRASKTNDLIPTIIQFNTL